MLIFQKSAYKLQIMFYKEGRLVMLKIDEKISVQECLPTAENARLIMG